MFVAKAYCNYPKLKSNLRLCCLRLQNLQKKKTELNVRARRDLADYLKNNKIDRARIRVQAIVRDDYLIEVYDILETFCELLISRMGLIETSNEIDPGLMDAIATILWVSPRLISELPELKVVSKEFTSKYGKIFAESCMSNSSTEVNPKVKQKMSVRAPQDNLCEAYLVEIARSYDVAFTPDKNLLNNSVGTLLDLGEVPSLPNMDILSQDYDDYSKNSGEAGNAPYPTDPSFQQAGLPPLPDEKSDMLINFGGQAPPPYDHPSTASAESDEKPAEFKSDSLGFNQPPSTDDKDLDDLSARFRKLKDGK